MLPVDAHIMNHRSSEQLWPVIPGIVKCYLLWRGIPFLASVRWGVVDEKLWKENCHHGVIRYNLLIYYQASVRKLHGVAADKDLLRVASYSITNRSALGER